MAWIDFNLFNLIKVKDLNHGRFKADGGAAWVVDPPQTITGKVSGSCRANVANQGSVNASYNVGDRRDVFVEITCRIVNDSLYISTFSSSTDYKVESSYIDNGNNTFVVNIDYRSTAG